MASPHVSGIAVLMQQLATQEIGRRLSPTEFETLMRAAAVEFLPIPSTGASYLSMDVLSLGESVLAMKNSTIDVRGVAFDVNDVMVRGQTGTATITLGNTGTTASGPVQVDIYLSTNGTISTTGDWPLGSIAVANVPAGSTSVPVNFNFTLPVPNDPFWQSSTSYTIGAVIDKENLIGESDESNNFRRGSGLDSETVTITKPPSDLRGASFAVNPTSTERGQPIQVDYAIGNIGIGPTFATTVAFYLSRDTTIDPATDLLLGTASVAPILAGQSSGVKTRNLLLPENANPIWSTFTDFTIGMVVDSSNTETESNEGNNRGVGIGIDSAAITIVPPPTRIRGTVFHDANNNGLYNGPLVTTVSVERAIQGASLRPGVTTTLTFDDLPANLSGATMRFRGVGDFDEVSEFANISIDGLISTRVFDKEPLIPSGFFTIVDETILLEGSAWQAAMLDGALSVVVTFNNPGSFSTGSANYLRVTLEYAAQSHDQYHVASTVENRVLDNPTTNVTLAASRPSTGDATLRLVALGDVGGIEETATINLEGLIQFTVFDLVDTGEDNAEAFQSVIVPKATLDLLMADGIVNANIDFNAAVNMPFAGNFFQLRLDYPIETEPGVAGVNLSIDHNDDGTVDQVVTTIADDPLTALNEAGQYEFSGVATGANRVVLNPPIGAVPTVPSNGQTVVNVIAGELRESVNFGIFDSNAPNLISRSPLDDAVSVPLNAPLVMQFDEAVQPGTGAIVIRRSADQSVFQSLNIRSTDVVFNGSTVVATPTLPLLSGTQYYVEIASGTIVDRFGNPWVGITNPNDWNFTPQVNRPPTALALSSTHILENVPAGSLVGTFATTDPDVGNTFTYSFANGAGNADNSAFTINLNSLTINASPDFETKSSYSVRIRTTDQDGLFLERSFVISVGRVPVIDLATFAAFQGVIIYGGDVLDQSGRSLSNAGDVNGDGYDDLLIGAFTADAFGNSRDSAGDTYVVFGGPTLPATIDLANLGSAGIAIVGAERRDFSGIAVSSAGDINGDGFDDLIIAAPNADAAGNLKSYAGENYVVFGAPSLPATIDLANLGSAGITIYGADANDRLGIAVSSAGDVNGDGFDDLLIAAYFASAAGNAKLNAGEAYVIFGATTMPNTINLANSGSAGITIFGADAGDNSGRGLSSVGDVNGDGFDDLIIGANKADGIANAKTDSGESYLIFGAATPPTTIDLANLGSAGTIIYGADANDLSGTSVSGAGDVNGDGFDDFIIGSYRADRTGNLKADSGESYVIFGAASFPATIDLANLGSAGFIILGVDAGDSSGQSVSRAGDVNGDGLDDLIIGAHTADGIGNAKSAAGEVYVIFGAVTFPATIDLANLGSGGIRILGSDVNDQSGRSVSNAGDVNGDGFDDLLIGAIYGDALGNAKSNAGESYLIYGGNAFTDSIFPINLGTSAANTIAGTAGVQILNGADGNDILVGNGGADILIGGRGDDILAVSDMNFKRIVGGNGNDTLRLDGSGLTLDLTTIRDNRILDIEVIDIRGTGSNTLVLNAKEVRNLSSHSNTLLVLRNLDDTVSIGTGWTQGANEVIGLNTFNVFTQGNAVIKLQEVRASIAARHVFYNNATGANLSSAGAANNAIASDKSPLLPGNASTFANYSNYSRGLNGIIFDVNNLPATTTNSQILASLQFAQWNGISAAGFAALPIAAVPTATIFPGSGTGGSNRVKITFPDNTLQNTWLRVTVVSNLQTGLAANDIFIFGNVIGDFNTGNTETRLRVNATDTAAVRSNQSTAANSASVMNIFDVNRDGRVNATDTSIIRSNQQTSGIVAPLTAFSGAAPAASLPGNPDDTGKPAQSASSLWFAFSWSIPTGSRESNVTEAFRAITYQEIVYSDVTTFVSLNRQSLKMIDETTPVLNSELQSPDDLRLKTKDDFFAGFDGRDLYH